MTVPYVPDTVCAATETIKLTSYVVSVDPKISVIPEFLSDRECQHLIGLSEEVGFTRSLVGRGKYGVGEEDKSSGLVNLASDNRTSTSVTLEPSHDPTVAAIEQRLAALVGLPVEQLESLVVVKYESGQFFGHHHDGLFRPYTVFVYLNDLPPGGGGETRFPMLSLRVRPTRGTAVLWRNSLISDEGEVVEDPRLVHEGLPTDGCTKYGVNCFFNEHVMRTPY